MTPHLPAERRVFVVEDHDAMRASLVWALGLEKAMTVCGTAESAEEALNDIPEADPDLVLVDVSLPGMSGIKLVERLGVQCPGLPVLVLSGHDVSVYGGQAEQAGAVGYVMKSGGLKRILEAVYAALAPPV